MKPFLKHKGSGGRQPSVNQLQDEVNRTVTETVETVATMETVETMERTPQPAPDANPAVTPSPIPVHIPVDRAVDSENRVIGRPALGLYPRVSRRKLAAATGLSIKTVSALLRGRDCHVRVAVLVAGVLGVSVESLSAELEEYRSRRNQGKDNGNGDGK